MNQRRGYTAPGIGLPAAGAVLFLFACIAFPNAATAFSLSPQGTALERVTAQQREPWYRRWIIRSAGQAIRHFAEPVHEEITHRIYDCDADAEYCAQLDIEFAPPAVLYGVRWNDDPPFGLSARQAANTGCKINESIRLITQPNCWRQLFSDAQKGAAAGKEYTAESGAALLYRVHLGDLQFLHSMASKEGERASFTHRRILAWAEFTWRLAAGEYGLGTLLKDVKIEGFNKLIGRPEWRVQDLFTYGIDRVRPHIRDIAFGSLLHMVQDSFAKGHVARGEPTHGARCPNAGQHPAPGKIREFHAYNNQDHREHARYDERKMLMAHVANTRPHVVRVGRTLREYYEAKASWEAVRPYIECAFALENPEAKASAGEGFERR